MPEEEQVAEQDLPEWCKARPRTARDAAVARDLVGWISMSFQGRGYYHKASARYRYLLEQGRFYSPGTIPLGYKRGEPTYQGDNTKACFEVPQLLALEHPELTYVEGSGFQVIRGVIRDTEHAWCVTAEGAVLDPTRTELSWSYLGVRFETDAVRNHREKKSVLRLPFPRMLTPVLYGAPKTIRVKRVPG